MSSLGPSVMITPPAGNTFTTRKPASSSILNGIMPSCSWIGIGRNVTLASAWRTTASE